jgi:hypothetical protein
MSHEVLLSKLQLCGVTGSMLNWFRSYLSDRKQRVSLELAANQRFLSHWEPMKCRFHQGFVLGPTLFMMYIDDLPKVMNKLSHAILYADDTNIIVTVTNYNELQNKVN